MIRGCFSFSEVLVSNWTVGEVKENCGDEGGGDEEEGINEGGGSDER